MIEPTTCQDGDMRGASTPVSRLRVLAMRSREQVQREGVMSLIRRTVSFVGRRMPHVPASGRPAPARSGSAKALGLQQGEWVQVKSEADIRQTLDGAGRTQGLRFMPGMLTYCGQRLRVYKRAEVIVLEGTGETRRLKDTVLLEASICGGEGFVCDRSCFYFWKEHWLTRVDGDDQVSGQSRSTQSS